MEQANKGFRDVGLGFEITAETPTGPVLEESSNTVPFQVGPEQNYTFSMTFDNTIANSSVWFQYVGPLGRVLSHQESRGMVVVSSLLMLMMWMIDDGIADSGTTLSTFQRARTFRCRSVCFTTRVARRSSLSRCFRSSVRDIKTLSPLDHSESGC